MSISVNFPPSIATAEPGSAGAPGYHFTSSATDGLYLVAAGTLGFATGGTQRATLSSSGLVLVSGQFQAPDGTAGAPSHSFANSLATGLYRIGTNILGMATAGTERLRVDASGLVGIGGAAGASALFQVTSTTLGALPAPSMTTTQQGNISSPANGLLVFNTTTNQYEFNSGSSGSPTWSAVGTSLTSAAILSPGSSTRNLIQASGAFIDFVLKAPASGTPNLLDFQDSSGAVIASVTNAALLRLPDGSASTPGHSFVNQTGMGFYRVTTNVLGVATAGTGCWKWDASGHFLAITDNSFDVGASGATRPRTVYAGTAIVAPDHQVATTLTMADAANVVLNTTTGTKIGTATSQKLGFYNSTPIVQPSNTTDLRTALINLGLYASGGASPLNLNGGALTAGSLTLADAGNIVVGTGTGTKIGTATSQKLGFFNASPVAQQTGCSAAVIAAIPDGSTATCVQRLQDLLNALGFCTAPA